MINTCSFSHCRAHLRVLAQICALDARVLSELGCGPRESNSVMIDHVSSIRGIETERHALLDEEDTNAPATQCRKGIKIPRARPWERDRSTAHRAEAHAHGSVISARAIDSISFFRPIACRRAAASVTGVCSRSPSLRSGVARRAPRSRWSTT